MSEAGDNNLLQIARVLKSNGIEGELVLGFRDLAPEDIDLKEPVFIEFDGLPVPFYFESFNIKGNRAFARLNDISNLEEAEELVGRAVYAEEGTIEDEEDDSLPDLTGWTLLDAVDFDAKEIKRTKALGKISDIVDIPGNPCIEVDTKKGAVLVPLHEDLILSVDPDNLEIIMDIPEGLF